MLGRKIVTSLTGFSTHVFNRSAGHSKWANIKHIKAEKDGERAQMYVRLCQKIKIAIQEGGSANPEQNLFLAQAVEAARKKNMPVTSIQNCIKSSQADPNKQQIVWYEIRGPGGCYIIAQAFVEAPKRSRDLVTGILKRHGASFADNSGKNLFDQKGIIVATAKEASDGNLDKAIDDAIECGAEEVVPAEEEHHLKFICGIQDVNVIKTKLAGKNYNIVSAEYEFIPKMRVELSDADIETVSKLMSKLEEFPDIVKIYDNIA